MPLASPTARGRPRWIMLRARSSRPTSRKISSLFAYRANSRAIWRRLASTRAEASTILPLRATVTSWCSAAWRMILQAWVPGIRKSAASSMCVGIAAVLSQASAKDKTVTKPPPISAMARIAASGPLSIMPAAPFSSEAAVANCPTKAAPHGGAANRDPFRVSNIRLVSATSCLFASKAIHLPVGVKSLAGRHSNLARPRDSLNAAPTPRSCGKLGYGLDQRRRTGSARARRSHPGQHRSCGS